MVQLVTSRSSSSTRWFANRFSGSKRPISGVRPQTAAARETRIPIRSTFAPNRLLLATCMQLPPMGTISPFLGMIPRRYSAQVSVRSQPSSLYLFSFLSCSPIQLSAKGRPHFFQISGELEGWVVTLWGVGGTPSVMMSQNSSGQKS